MKVPAVLWWIASGFLFGVSFVSPFLFWCFIPGFVLFLRAIAEENSLGKVFWLGLLVGMLQYAGSFFWIWSIYPINWMPDQSPLVQFAAIGAYWVLTSAVMGVGSGLFALCVKKVCTSISALIIGVPVIWLASELCKSIIFSVYSFGPGSFISASFSFGYIGYLLAPYGAWVHVGAFAGVYGLSLCAALLGVWAYMFFTQKAYANPYALVCVVVLAGIPFAIPQSLISRAQENQQSVVSVETYFDKSFYQKSDWEEVKNQEMKSAVERALAEDTSVIVLPEDADFSRAFGSADDVLAWLAQRTQGRDVVLVDNSIAKDARHKNVMRTYIYDTESSSLYFFDKKYLVPQGEFLSYLHEGILSAFTSDDGMAAIKRYARLEPGIQSDSMALPNYLPGVLFCFETAVPYAVQKIESIRNPSLVVHPISYAWFTNPYSLEYQLKQMLRVQAVWSGTPIVSAGSMTQSAAYLEDGSVLLGTTVASNRFWVVKRFDF